MSQARNQAATDRISYAHEHDRDGAGHTLQTLDGGCPDGHKDFRAQREQFRRILTITLAIPASPAIVDLQIATNVPAQFLQPPRHLRRAALPGSLPA